MTPNIDLKQIERKAFLSTFQDGVLDICLGLWFIPFAIMPLINDLGFGDFWSSAVTFPFFSILAFLTFWVGKKFITTPRIGLVRYGPERKTRLKRMHAIIFALLLINLIVAGLETHLRNFLYHQARIEMLMLISFSLGAYFLNLARLYAYGVLMALSFLTCGMLGPNTIPLAHHGYPVVFGFSSAVLLAIGLLLLLRFLRKYPLPTKEA